MSTPYVEKGQVTIPHTIRRRLNLKKGDLVTFIETEDGVLIKPAEVVAIQALDTIGQVLKKKGLDLDQLLERGRQIRGRLVEEEYGLVDDENSG